MEKEIYGQLFRNKILFNIYNNCEKNKIFHRNSALQKLKGIKKSAAEVESLLTEIIRTLQNSRLTINFNASKIEPKVLFSKDFQVVNSFAFKQKPGEINDYNIGRQNTERITFSIESIEKDPYAKYGANYGNFEQFGQFSKNRDFQWTSRPCYAALDFLEGTYGGAVTYGKSFLVLNDYLKHVSSYCPVDTFQAMNFNKLCTFFHFENLIANCQNDWFGYNCLDSLVRKAKGQEIIPHVNYGVGGRNNYIDTQVYNRIYLNRDVKEIHISNEELNLLNAKAKTEYLKSFNSINLEYSNKFKRKFIILH